MPEARIGRTIDPSAGVPTADRAASARVVPSRVPVGTAGMDAERRRPAAADGTINAEGAAGIDANGTLDPMGGESADASADPDPLPRG